MEMYIEKAKVLVEALPYIKEFYGKTVVIKYGGSAMVDEMIKETVIQDIILMKLVGINPVIVHGGGPDINKILKQMDKKSEFVNGLRVTDQETMEIVEMVLAGKVNKSIVSHIQNQGINAVGISGKDGATLQAEKKLVNGMDVGFVGEVVNVNTELISTLIQKDFIPVIAPIGIDKEGNSYNINADYAAVAVAGALKAQKLVFLTDVEGVLKDVSDSSSIISRLSIKDVDEYIKNGIISGGMIPKVECCVEGVKKGVKTVHILDGRVEHCLLLEIFTQKGVGTMIEE
ncbi:acetylglutamate kinase [Defluviitalea raffinosedens]|jgi:acetylglutamate kinase|uniref:Acetylglutamate kinase n=1 Tax=Defluviitalea raffinosedens TaxID=1450156 RepID=A0A7C8HGM2_9FIRM|nr:acetylglutamate kinase [Defluviitalea raffinosedens]KAE9637330.1 acetylglutamate kinase [Defluviitalea raffinosedens]MBM7685637.1 acetylglutamate kinase [Defluviitalea raffinosedens]MBZ4669673.1 argB [Defluviitaleaceae bacterium]HHW66634.1 acetylglutamate kinase [Candidatus Epulonipiscium sp.]